MNIQETPKRADLRREIPATPVQMIGMERTFLGYAKNVSRSGIFIKTYIPCNVGEELDIEFSLPDVNITVACRSKVIWCKAPWSLAGTIKEGLKFVDIDPVVADKIDTWAKGQTNPWA